MSRLGLHWQLRANWMRRVYFSSEYVKMIDPPEDNVFPDKKIIGRVYMSDGEEGALYSQGKQGGAAYFERCANWYRRAPYIAAWEGIANEPAMIHTADERARLDEATVEWCRLMDRTGLQTVVGNFSERNPPDGTMREFAGMLSTGDYLGLHCYDAPTLRTHGYVLRYRQMIDEIRAAGLRVPPVLLTECGVDGGVVGLGRRGWQKMPNYDWGKYLADLVWLDSELEQDVDVVGAVVFTAAPSKDWRSFGISERQARELANALR